MDCYAHLRTDTDIERSTPGSTDGVGHLRIRGSRVRVLWGAPQRPLQRKGLWPISHRVRSPLGVAGSRLGHESIRTGIADPQVMSPIWSSPLTWENARHVWSDSVFASHHFAFFPLPSHPLARWSDRDHVASATFYFSYPSNSNVRNPPT